VLIRAELDHNKVNSTAKLMNVQDAQTRIIKYENNHKPFEEQAWSY
jgi:hypothetical protein